MDGRSAEDRPGTATISCWCSSHLIPGSNRLAPDQLERSGSCATHEEGGIGWPDGVGRRATNGTGSVFAQPRQTCPCRHLPRLDSKFSSSRDSLLAIVPLRWGQDLTRWTQPPFDVFCFAKIPMGSGSSTEHHPPPRDLPSRRG